MSTTQQDSEEPPQMQVLSYAQPRRAVRRRKSSASIAFFFSTFLASVLAVLIAVEAISGFGNSVAGVAMSLVAIFVIPFCGSWVLVISTLIYRFLRADLLIERGAVVYGMTGIGYVSTMAGTWWTLHLWQMDQGNTPMENILQIAPVLCVPVLAPLWLFYPRAHDEIVRVVAEQMARDDRFKAR